MLTLLLISNIVTIAIAIHYYNKSRVCGFTKLLNKEQFNKDVQNMKRADDMVVIIDINKFKQLNDTMGHAYGDKIIEQLATHIRNNIRKSDRAYRIGGDEFAIITNNPQLGQRIKENCGVDISVGVGYTYNEADENMYKNKRGA